MKERPMHEIRTVEPAGYAEFLAELKQRIERAQLRASLAVNRELVLLYWQIGREILSRQDRESWGAKVIDRRRRLKALLPRHAGLLTQESQIHARFRRSLGGGGICASGACTNHLVSQHCPYGETPNSGGPRLLCALRSSTAGAETFSFTKSNQPSICGKAGQ